MEEAQFIESKIFLLLSEKEFHVLHILHGNSDIKQAE